MNILSSFAQTYVVPNLNDFLSVVERCSFQYDYKLSNSENDKIFTLTIALGTKTKLNS